MADIPASPADATQKAVITVPATEEPIISVFTDPELTQSSVMMFARREAMPKEFKNTLIGISYNYIYSFVMQMMSARFDEIAQAADAPFLGGGMSEGGSSPLLLDMCSPTESKISKGFYPILKCY